MEKDTFDNLVQTERLRQDYKWVEQNHDPFIWLAILGEEYGELQKAVLEKHFCELYPISQSEKVEVELIHVAAVAKAMYESGKRNGWL